jgi:hypothetical protein
LWKISNEAQENFTTNTALRERSLFMGTGAGKWGNAGWKLFQPLPLQVEDKLFDNPPCQIWKKTYCTERFIKYNTTVTPNQNAYFIQYESKCLLYSGLPLYCILWKYSVVPAIREIQLFQFSAQNIVLLVD